MAQRAAEALLKHIIYNGRGASERRRGFANFDKGMLRGRVAFSFGVVPHHTNRPGTRKPISPFALHRFALSLSIASAYRFASFLVF